MPITTSRTGGPSGTVKTPEEAAKKKAAAKQARKGLSLRQILRNAPADPDIRNSRYVSVMNSARDKLKWSKHTLQTVTLTRVPNETPRRQLQTIWTADKDYEGPLSKCPAIKVDCSCKRHQFMWDYALWKHGASDRMRSINSPPVETNPRMIPGCCKHLAVVIDRILKRGL